MILSSKLGVAEMTTHLHMLVEKLGMTGTGMTSPATRTNVVYPLKCQMFTCPSLHLL